MSTMNAAAAHEVVRDLGTLVSRDQLSHQTRFPTAHSPSVHVSVVSRLSRALKRFVARRRLTAELSGMSPHLLRDVGLDPTNLESSISDRLDRTLAEREAGPRQATLGA